MNGAFYIGATGLDAQQRALDAVANNIANLNTPGFKRSAVRFSEMVGRDPATPVVGGEGADRLAGVTSDADQRVWDQGDLKQTGSSLDIAVDGAGFLEVLGSDGQIEYWRGGTLKVGDDGYLATSEGNVLRAMISVPREATGITIGRDGVVRAIVDGKAAEDSEVGRLELAMIDDKASLRPIGGGYYASADGRPARLVEAGVEEGGAIVQGALEGSNVELSEQMINLLVMQRAFAANAQVVQAGDQLMSITNNLRR